MRVLISGVAGFIASHVAENCLKLGMSVVGIDDLSGGKVENVPEGVEFHECSVTYEPFDNRPDLSEIFNWYEFDAVYHLAAYAAEGLSHFIRRFNYTNNLIGTTNIVNECIKQGQRTGKFPHLVFTSSIAVYGHPPIKAMPSMVTEDTQPNPIDCYGIAKLACELDIKAANAMWGLPYTIFRPYNIYGERQNLSDAYRNVVGIFMRQAIQGKPFTIFGDGTQTRAFSYVDDVAPIIARAPGVKEARNEIFNVGGGRSFDVNYLARVVSNEFGRNHTCIHLPERNEVKQIAASPAKVRSVFCPPTPVSLEDGISRMGDWARTQTIEEPKAFADIEVDLGLPPSWEALRK